MRKIVLSLVSFSIKWGQSNGYFCGERIVWFILGLVELVYLNRVVKIWNFGSYKSLRKILIISIKSNRIFQRTRKLLKFLEQEM